ncbi:MAG: hypothetical protein IPF99_23840 [Deltaproteobacteria bacterium]|nr:hypothetical protein [Deltaproteobacteria bacterium]
MLMRSGVVVVGLCAGCAVTPGGESAAPATATVLTRSEPFSLAASPSAPAIAPEGDGVTVRWMGAQALSIPAESAGLGPVLEARRGAGGDVTLVHRDGVEERWTVTAAGAEQAWRYPSRPAGDRVAVTVTLAGARLDHEADDGLWLRAATGELLRYSHATWVDADGRRTAVRSRWVDGRIAVEVPAEVVAASAYPATLDPTLTPAFGLEAPRSSPLGTLGNVQMARTPSGWLVFTPILATSSGTINTPLIMVQRLDASGARVEGSFRPVSATSTINGSFQVAPSGAGAWMVWQAGTRVVGVRLDATGNAVDPAAVPLQSDLSLVDLACNASQCLLLGTRGTQIVVSRFSLAGAPLDPAPVVVATVAGSYSFGRRPLAVLDDRFVATWSQVAAGSTADVVLARVGLDGVVQDPGGRAVTAAGAVRVSPSLASNGSGLFLTLRADASGPRPAGLYALALDRELAAVTPLSVLLPREIDTYGSFPLWDGARWLVASITSLVRFAADGTRLDATSLPISQASSSTQGAFVIDGEQGGLFVFRSAVNPPSYMGGVGTSSAVQRVASDGTVTAPPAPLSLGYVGQIAPSVDSDGTEFVTAWTPSGSAITLARVSAAGVVRDVPSVPLATAAGVGTTLLLDGATVRVFGNISGLGTGRVAVDLNARTTGPTLRFTSSVGRATVVRGNGQRLLFLGDSSGNAAIHRLDAAGERLDPNPIPLPPSYALAADFDGTRYLMAYAIIGGTVFVRRLDASGDFTEVSPRNLSVLGPVTIALRLAFGGSVHLLAWIDAARQVRATRLGLDGALLDATPLLLGSAEGLGTPDVALSYNGRNFVAVWSNNTDRRLRAARVSLAGVSLDATPLVLTEEQARSGAQSWSSARRRTPAARRSSSTTRSRKS